MRFRVTNRVTWYRCGRAPWSWPKQSCRPVNPLSVFTGRVSTSAYPPAVAAARSLPGPKNPRHRAARWQADFQLQQARQAERLQPGKGEPEGVPGHHLARARGQGDADGGELGPLLHEPESPLETLDLAHHPLELALDGDGLLHLRGPGQQVLEAIAPPARS
jgi:hypothetical protein